ncbi:MAG: energy-coupling factor transporter transmembrane protein EcfT [Anaerolineaceae bacterium]|nr:energy-coupling factor transporter transmembrane protein EcfT [Anaerolineaceae bacterium]
MDAELYIDNNSFIHRLDPRTKITVFLLTFVAILLFEDPLWMLPVAFLIMLQIIVCGALVNLRRIRYILIVLTVSSMILWNLFSKGVTPLFWFITVESFSYAIARTMLMTLMISAGMILITTTRNEELVKGMIMMGLPYRVGFAISTALRLVPTIASSTLTISQAQRSRGLDLDSGNLLERIRKFLPLLVPVFISTIRNTNIFAMALEAKGFGAREERTSYLELNMRTVDYIILAFTVLFVAGSVVFYAMGYGHIAGLTRF